MKPDWVNKKEELKTHIEEELVFVGESGAAGVIDGKLPNGDIYEWSKKDRKTKRKLKRPKAVQ